MAFVRFLWGELAEHWTTAGFRNCYKQCKMQAARPISVNETVEQAEREAKTGPPPPTANALAIGAGPAGISPDFLIFFAAEDSYAMQRLALFCEWILPSVRQGYRGVTLPMGR